MTKSLILALLRKGILDIPLMFALNALLPMYGIVCATPAADIICCISAAVLFVMFIKKHEHNAVKEETTEDNMTDDLQTEPVKTKS